MSKCFTCGRPIDPDALRYTQQSFAGLFPSLYTCTHCENLKITKDIREQAEAQTKNFQQQSHQQSQNSSKVSAQLDNLSQIEKQGFETLQRELKSGFGGVQQELKAGFDGVQQDLAQLTSVVEWAMQDISWRISQQTDVLLGIDQTLKTPLETQANELRQMAEELFNRGALKDAESRFLRAVEMNPLDYRIYVGLAHVYIAQGNFEDAKRFLESSLPHAPRSEFDYKSYSYRLIGRIHFSKEENQAAVAVLKQAVQLSPKYPEARWDYAQYAALVGDDETSLAELSSAIGLQPQYWMTAKYEQNFEPIRSRVATLLTDLAVQAAQQAQNQADSISGAVQNIFDEVPKLRSLADDLDVIGKRVQRAADRGSIRQIESDVRAGQTKIRLAVMDIKPDDYLTTLDAQKSLNDISSTTFQIKAQVHKARQDLQNLRSQYMSEIEKNKQGSREGATSCGFLVLYYGWIVILIAAVIITIATHASFGSGIIIFLALMAVAYGIVYGASRLFFGLAG